MFLAALLFRLNHLRFSCSQISIKRLDPLVNSGMISTPHVHQTVHASLAPITTASSLIQPFRNCGSEAMPSTPPCPAPPSPNSPHARPAAPPTTSQTIGPQTSTLKPVMAASSASRKSPLASSSINDKFTTQTKGGTVVYCIAPTKNTVTACTPIVGTSRSTSQNVRISCLFERY
jgi:hypothetical protein